MNSYTAEFEPAATSTSQMCRLFDARDPEHPFVELGDGTFLALGHGELHMVDVPDHADTTITSDSSGMGTRNGVVGVNCS